MGWAGGQAGFGQAGRWGGTGLAMLCHLNSPSFNSCQTLSETPMAGALRILQPREMESSESRWSEPLFCGKLETTSICLDRLPLGKGEWLENSVLKVMSGQQFWESVCA